MDWIHSPRSAARSYQPVYRPNTLRSSRTTSRHRRLGPWAGRGVWSHENNTAFGSRWASILAMWPSHCSRRRATMSATGSVAHILCSEADDRWSSHCLEREMPRMTRTQRLWNCSRRRMSARNSVQFSAPYNSTDNTQHVYVRCSHTHTHTHTQTHTHTRAHTHTPHVHKHARAHTHTHTHTHKHIYPHTHKDTLTQMCCTSPWSQPETWYNLGHNQRPGTTLVTTRDLVQPWSLPGTWYNLGHYQGPGTTLVTTRDLVQPWPLPEIWYNLGHYQGPGTTLATTRDRRIARMGPGGTCTP